jgi:hypothetical protein
MSEAEEKVPYRDDEEYLNGNKEHVEGDEQYADGGGNDAPKKEECTADFEALVSVNAPEWVGWQQHPVVLTPLYGFL